jgi:hypothetical protein
MSTSKKKRDVPITPTRQGANEQQPMASPTKPPDKKKTFTGATAMDEDIGPRKMTPEEERESRRLEREARKLRIERQKMSGVKEKSGKSTGAGGKVGKQKAYQVDDEETVNSSAKQQEAPKKGRSRKSDVGVLGGKTVQPGKPRGRARSVPPPVRRGRGSSRASSVDSAVSNAVAAVTLPQAPPSVKRTRSNPIAVTRRPRRQPSSMIVFPIIQGKQLPQRNPHVPRGRRPMRRRPTRIRKRSGFIKR